MPERTVALEHGEALRLRRQESGEQVRLPRAVLDADHILVQGKLGNDVISIANLYKQRSTLDPYTIQGEDTVAKMMKAWTLVRSAKDKSYIRLTGCRSCKCQHRTARRDTTDGVAACWLSRIRGLVCVHGREFALTPWPNDSSRIEISSQRTGARMSVPQGWRRRVRIANLRAMESALRVIRFFAAATLALVCVALLAGIADMVRGKVITRSSRARTKLDGVPGAT